MPLTTSKTRGFTLELGIETKSREIILIRCFLIVVYNPPFLIQLFGKLVYHFSKNFAASIPFCVSYSYYDEVVHFNKMCSYHLPVSGQWISPVDFSHVREGSYLVHPVFLLGHPTRRVKWQKCSSP